MNGISSQTMCLSAATLGMIATGAAILSLKSEDDDDVFNLIAAINSARAVFGVIDRLGSIKDTSLLKTIGKVVTTVGMGIFAGVLGTKLFSYGCHEIGYCPAEEFSNIAQQFAQAQAFQNRPPDTIKKGQISLTGKAQNL